MDAKSLRTELQRLVERYQRTGLAPDQIEGELDAAIERLGAEAEEAAASEAESEAEDTGGTGGEPTDKPAE